MKINKRGIEEFLGAGIKIILNNDNTSVHYQQIGGDVETTLYINGCYIINNFKNLKELNYSVFSNLKKIKVVKNNLDQTILRIEK